MQVRLNDPTTLQAIGILADVLDDITGPERLECLMAANALRQVVETQSQTALNFARQAFESLPGGVRHKIHTDATEAAVQVVQRHRDQGPRIIAGRLARPAPKPSASPMLDALNSGGLKTERKWNS